MSRMDETQKKKGYLLPLGAAHSLNHSLFVIAPPLLGLIMTSLGASKSEIGLVATVASFLYGAGALVGGPLGDRIGEAKTIATCLAFSGLSTFIMLAAGVMGSIYVYAAGLATMAFWASLYHPTANSLISKAFKGGISEAMGLHGVGGTLGVVFTPTVAWFIGANYGWPLAFVAFGILCTILSLVFVDSGSRIPLILVFLCVADFSLFYYALVQYATLASVALMWLLAFLFILLLCVQRTTGSRRNGSQKISSGGTIVDALKIRGLWVLLIFNVAIGLYMKGVELFFPTYLTENRAVSSGWAALAYTFILAVGSLRSGSEAGQQISSVQGGF